jgi:ATP-dependent Clp protease ATP-binding subunit ClpA
MNIDYDIKRLENLQALNEKAFEEKTAVIYERIDKLEKQLDKSSNQHKRHVILTRIDFYENELSKLHDALEIVTTDIENKLKKMKEIRDEQLEKKKQKTESLDYNVKYLREAISRRNVNEIYSMFESVVNCIDILEKRAKDC